MNIYTHLPEKTRSVTLAALSLIAVVFTTAALTPAEPTLQAAAGTNLIANADFETADSNGAPLGWNKNSWGTLTPTFTYPVAGASGKAAEVRVTNYASGDAKWYFAPVQVEAGKQYRYSSTYRASAITSVVAAFVDTNGRYTYKWLANAPSASTWTSLPAVSVTPPSGTVRMSIYHVLARNGTLAMDNVVLEGTQAAPPSPAPTDEGLIANESLESQSGDAPLSWSRSSWGKLTATWAYPVAGKSGKAAEVRVSNYVSGDAKWVHTPVSVAEGATYRYTSTYRANTTCHVVLEYKNGTGALSYVWLGATPASDSFTEYTTTFTVPAGMRSVTVFHLIAQNGTLAVDRALLTKTSTPPPVTPGGMVSVTFDDGWVSQYNNALPLLDRYNTKATFYIITDTLEPGKYEGYMSPSQVKDVRARGHEIGSHSVTHADLVTVSSTTLWMELTRSRTALEDLLGAEISALAYPYGSYNSAVITEAKRAGYKSARTTDDEALNSNSTDVYRLRSYSPTVNTPLSVLTDALAQARARDEWLVIALHEIHASGGEYSNTPAYLESLLQAIRDSGVPAVTISQGLQAIRE